MSKFKHFKTVIAAVCAVLCFAAAASALQPEDILIPRPEKSVYTVMRIDNLGDFLRWAVPASDLKLIAPVFGMDEGILNMVLGTLEKIPAQSIVLLGGSDNAGNMFLQFAAAMPDSLKPKLDLIAKGEAKTEDLAAVLLGEGSPVAPMAGAMLEVQPVKDEAGLISVNGAVVIGAKDNLLIMGLSPAEVKAGFAALEDPEKRLKLKRNFNTKSFAISHIDVDTLEKIEPPSKDGITKENYEMMRSMLKAPVESETAFESLADRNRISFFVNIKECASDKYAATLNEKPVKGGHFKLMGDRSPILAFGSIMNGEAVKEALNQQADLKKLWTEMINGLKSVNISEELLMNVLTGSMTFSVGGSLVNAEGMKLPAVYIAKEGVKGAAAELIKAVEAKEKAHLMPIEANGWDKLLQIDSSVSPVSVLFGNQGDMLYAGFSEKDSLAQTPKVSGQFAEILDKESIGAGYFDFAAIQNYFKDDSTKVMAFASAMAPGLLGDKTDAVMAQINEILNAKLSVPSMGFWAVDYGTCYLDFMKQDVAPEDGLVAKLVKLYQILDAPETEAPKEEPEKAE